jgi:gliding motility-associated lipoprotein GldD
LPLNDNLQEHTEESRKLAYKHDVMADAIAERIYINDSLNVYGILYDYDGMTATAAQFYLTDSTSHFFRGALYFNTEISDSLLPVNNFLKEDVKHIIESFRWISQ